MRIISFNANGLRSAVNKGFFDWFQNQHADFLCVQETKAHMHQISETAFMPKGYQRYLHDAHKKGYSGMALYCRREPDEILTTLGWEAFDTEGRYLEARFGQLSVVSLYLPSGSSGEIRQHFKFQVMEWLKPILDRWLISDRHYILCGDWNIVRSRLDIKNWTSNQKNSGCLPEERAWMNALCADTLEEADLSRGRGWIDTYRVLNPEGQDYTWWSNRGAARANDVGWRIDYQLVNPALRHRVKSVAIFPEPRFSDHAPFVVDYRE